MVKIDEVITVAEMAQQMSVKASDLIRQLMGNGVMAGLNHNLDFDTATLMAEEYGFTVESNVLDISFRNENKHVTLSGVMLQPYDFSISTLNKVNLFCTNSEISSFCVP